MEAPEPGSASPGPSGALARARALAARVDAALPQGPKLQFLNLTVLFAVVYLTIDYPNPLPYVVLNVALGAALDAAVSRYRFGAWRMPWPTMVGALGVTLVLDANGWFPFVLLPVLMVGSKHLIRWRGKHLFNPNNFAACALILLFMARVGVNDWGAAPQTLFLLLLFGGIATSRVKRLDLAVAYLLLNYGVYWFIALHLGWGHATVWMLAFSPVQVVIGLYAITDPATSPEGRREKLLWALLLVLLGVPATLAGRVEAPLFALLLGAPQRHLITYLVRGKWPPPASAPKPALAAPGPAAPAPPGSAAVERRAPP